MRRRRYCTRRAVRSPAASDLAAPCSIGWHSENGENQALSTGGSKLHISADVSLKNRDHFLLADLAMGLRILQTADLRLLASFLLFHVLNCTTFYSRPIAQLFRSLLVVVWLCAVGILGSSVGGGQDSSSSTTSTENCLRMFDTYSQGVYVCQQHSDLIVALEIAEELGREECQRAFHRERWNCSSFSILKAPNVTSPGETCCPAV